MSGSGCGGRRAAGAELVLVADCGGGGGDLAELHEVAVVADLVVAELVVVADCGGGGGDLAELHARWRWSRTSWSPSSWWSRELPSCDVGHVAQEHDTRR